MKRSTKKLPLAVETIRALKDAQLAEVNAGAPPITGQSVCICSKQLHTCAGGAC